MCAQVRALQPTHHTNTVPLCSYHRFVPFSPPIVHYYGVISVDFATMRCHSNREQPGPFIHGLPIRQVAAKSTDGLSIADYHALSYHALSYHALSYRAPPSQRTACPPQIRVINMAPTSGFELCFVIGSQHLLVLCPSESKPRLESKHLTTTNTLSCL